MRHIDLFGDREELNYKRERIAVVDEGGIIIINHNPYDDEPKQYMARDMTWSSTHKNRVFLSGFILAA